jgi:hypothetical protein
MLLKMISKRFFITNPYISKNNYHQPNINLYIFIYKLHIYIYKHMIIHVHYIGAKPTWFTFLPHSHGTSRAPTLETIIVDFMTWGRRLYFPPMEGVLLIFIAHKILSPFPRFELANSRER